jgi:uncharacterized protein (DUF952 family)
MTEPADDLIYHVCPRALAEDALAAGIYSAPSLASEGFIHFSRAHQVGGVLERFFAGRTELVLLVVDPTRLSAPLRYEPPAPVAGWHAPTAASDDLFPHLYGPLDTHAVVDVRAVSPEDGGPSA